jgi:hypothetical protein
VDISSTGSRLKCTCILHNDKTQPQAIEATKHATEAGDLNDGGFPQLLLQLITAEVHVLGASTVPFS